MDKIIIAHPQKQSVDKMIELFVEKKYDVEYWPTIDRDLQGIREYPFVLILLSTMCEIDCLKFLIENADVLKNKVIILNNDKTMDYILDCFNYGALNCFDSTFNTSEISTLVDLHFKSNKDFDPKYDLFRNIEKEHRVLTLENFDIYDSYKIDIVLEYLFRSIKNKLGYELYIGLMNSVYEVLVNAMEHGNLNIQSGKKEKLLQEGIYDSFLANNVAKDKKTVNVDYKYFGDEIILTVKDGGSGFIDRHETENEDSLRLSGRGLSIVKYFFDDVSFENNGATVILHKYLGEKGKR